MVNMYHLMNLERNRHLSPKEMRLELIKEASSNPDSIILEKEGLYLFLEIGFFKTKYEQNKDFLSAEERIAWDNIMSVLTNWVNSAHPEDVFNHITLTKGGKFPKSRNIILYRTGVKYTEKTEEYFAQSQKALILHPVYTVNENHEEVYCDDICELIVSDAIKPSKENDSLLNIDGSINAFRPIK